jgi:hypothetical protein
VTGVQTCALPISPKPQNPLILQHKFNIVTEMADEEDFETSPEKFDFNVSPSPEQTSVVDFSLAKKKSAPPNKKKNDEEG